MFKGMELNKKSLKVTLAENGYMIEVFTPPKKIRAEESVLPAALGAIDVSLQIKQYIANSPEEVLQIVKENIISK